MRDPKRLQRGGGACIRADYQHPPSSKCGPLPLSFCLPEDVLQHIRGQRGRAEHHKQALLGFTVGGRQLLQGRQADVRLDTGHGGRRRETLPGKTQAFMPVCSPVVEMQTSKIPPPHVRGANFKAVSHMRFQHLAAGRSVPHSGHHLSSNKLHGHPPHRATDGNTREKTSMFCPQHTAGTRQTCRITPHLFWFL